MKTLLKVIICIALLNFSSCDKSSDTANLEDNVSLRGNWNLVNVNGGFSGTETTFDSNLIQWTFNTIDNTITVQNPNVGANYDGLETGVYSFSIQEATDGNSYITIENEEFGSIDALENEIIINQNNRSNGVLSDGFVLHLLKV